MEQMTLLDATKRVGVNYMTAWHAWKRGDLPGVQFMPGGSIYVKLSDVQAFNERVYRLGRIRKAHQPRAVSNARP